MGSRDTDILNTELNPTVLTSRAALMGGAANGDPDAVKLLDLVKKDDRISETAGNEGGTEREKLYRFSSAYGTAVWARNKISGKLFDSLRMTNFVDLGCGLNPRGLEFSRRPYVRYYGIDLPPVIDRMKRALTPVIGPSDKIMYFSADVTDRDSLRRIIRTSEPLFIVTEGLMTYLTENEAQTVIGNISALLAEHGGVWFTADSEERMFFETLIRSLFGNNNIAMSNLIGTELSEQWRRLIHENSFTVLKKNTLADFLGKFGMECRKYAVGKLTAELDIPENIRKAYESTGFLIITPERTGVDHAEPDRKRFGIDTVINNDILTMRIHGRVDSISAPTIVEEYEKHCRENADVPLILDMADCPYISSAGIRAILMLYNRTSGIKDGFSIKNIRPEVFEIFTTTGLSDFV